MIIDAARIWGNRKKGGEYYRMPDKQTYINI